MGQNLLFDFILGFWVFLEIGKLYVACNVSGFLLFPLGGFLVPVMPFCIFSPLFFIDKSFFVVNKEKPHLIPSPDREEMILFVLNSSRPVF